MKDFQKAVRRFEEQKQDQARRREQVRGDERVRATSLRRSFDESIAAVARELAQEEGVEVLTQLDPKRLTATLRVSLLSAPSTTAILIFAHTGEAWAVTPSWETPEGRFEAHARLVSEARLNVRWTRALVCDVIAQAADPVGGTRVTNKPKPSPLDPGENSDREISGGLLRGLTISTRPA